MRNKKIAIVGGGVSGASTVMQLVKNATVNDANLEISIFSSTPDIGPGLPYHYSVAGRFLLNHEMTDMGGIDVRREVDQRDFFNWAQENLKTLQPLYPGFDLTNPDEYVPRNLYGKYITARYEEAKTLAAEKHIKLREIVGHVGDVAQGRRKVKILYTPKGTKETIEDHFDKVVLALGHAYAPSASQIEESGHYCKPHQAQTLIESGKLRNRKVIIQGSGQYADEIALAALDAGAAHVRMVSRHGWLHAVRGPYKPYTRRFLTLENLESRTGKGNAFRLSDVVDLLKQEIEYALGTSVNWNDVWEPKNIPEKLAKEIAFAETKQELKWRSALLSLKDIRQEIFERLDPEDKRKFNQEYRALFFAYQAPIPLKLAKRMLQAMESGKLEVLSGWQTSEWSPAEQKIIVRRVTNNAADHHALMPVPDHNVEVLEADYLISANGQTLDAEHIPLLRTMISHKDAIKNPSGGIKINTSTQHIMTESGENDNIYALGAITNGDRLINSNANVCMQSANVIAHDILHSRAVRTCPATARGTHASRPRGFSAGRSAGGG